MRKNGMLMEGANPEVEHYFTEGCGRCELGGTPECKVLSYPSALEEFRRIALSCGLIEELKWGCPCYTFEGTNIAMLAAFKAYASFSFFKGALLKDPEKILHSPGENSQAARQFRFTGGKEVVHNETVIRAYIFEAIEIEKAGLKIDFKAKHELELPEELLQKFEAQPEVKDAFEALTPGRQRGYVLHFTQPKNSATKISRIEKCIPKIMEGKGFHDR